MVSFELVKQIRANREFKKNLAIEICYVGRSISLWAVAHKRSNKMKHQNTTSIFNVEAWVMPIADVSTLFTLSE